MRVDWQTALGLLCCASVVGIVVHVFFLLTLQKALFRVSPWNRLLEPALVWLAFIPIFNIVWNFYLATRIPDSLRNEFRERGRDDGSDYGKSVGLAYAILVLVLAPLNIIRQFSRIEGMTCISGPILLAGLVVFIIFWVKIAGYSGRLTAPFHREDGPDYGRGDFPDDNYPEPRPQGPPSDAIRPEDPGHYGPR
jgi:uncharacterized membrane protein